MKNTQGTRVPSHAHLGTTIGAAVVLAVAATLTAASCSPIDDDPLLEHGTVTDKRYSSQTTHMEWHGGKWTGGTCTNHTTTTGTGKTRRTTTTKTCTPRVWDPGHFSTVIDRDECYGLHLRYDDIDGWRCVSSVDYFNAVIGQRL